MTIPKIIHYCWFGGKDKPDIVRRCLASWKQHLSDYQIIEWNETNLDIIAHRYTREAYAAGKFAFVSDYARVYALYHHGGIYLDTDVEVFQSFDNLLHHETFWGFEQANYIATSTIGAQKGSKLIQLFLDSYEDKPFLRADGSFDSLTNVAMITKMLIDLGLQADGRFQELPGIGAFYPQTYFSPFDYINCQTFMTSHTYTLHHFYKSWLPPKERRKTQLKMMLARLIGGHNIARIRGYLK
ncbi:glycosyltransferase family 32 protein [Paenibacillus roseipurpureus]|uniref:Capsular polysaccharide synthesis protein n=1 Tax=Paenibacillus roseopurpureus TaxID=2918901 RepID=A0AA96LML8_9BACL|nr:glycosyltransferase [Paenibacillus sp. MBLB1832]WNR43808.1 capsular polysaccharide synthesis protein [Paenibacillus sp. MBLB1832]